MKLSFRSQGNLCVAVLIEALVLTSLFCLWQPVAAAVTRSAFRSKDGLAGQDGALRAAHAFLWLGRQSPAFLAGAPQEMAGPLHGERTPLTRGLSASQPDDRGIWTCSVQMGERLLTRLYSTLKAQ